MNILIHRHSIREITCDGTLSINGIYLCDTAEHSQYRPPAGTYRITIRNSRKYKRMMPILEPLNHPKTNAPHFPFTITMGNGIYNRTDGRIIIGTHNVPGCLVKSKELFLKFFDRIFKTIKRGHEVTLTITEGASC